tara:strand:- start:155 stop:412 length:258 start_codon:yes stop_codon:yes gene_type:complete
MLINVVYVIIILILLYVIYIAIRAINTGMEAKNSFKSENQNENEIVNLENKDDFIDELTRLNELHKSGAINDEEFEKAKRKILKE